MSNRSFKTPPIGLVRCVEAAHAARQNLSQRLAPGNVTLIDLGLGGWTVYDGWSNPFDRSEIPLPAWLKPLWQGWRRGRLV